MKTLNNYITEKFKLNSKTIYNEIEDEAQKWIDSMKGEDFEYCLEIINYFLENHEFKQNYLDDVNSITKYENEPNYLKSVIKVFKKFKDDVEAQAKLF